MFSYFIVTIWLLKKSTEELGHLSNKRAIVLLIGIVLWPLFMAYDLVTSFIGQNDV